LQIHFNLNTIESSDEDDYKTYLDGGNIEENDSLKKESGGNLSEDSNMDIEDDVTKQPEDTTLALPDLINNCPVGAKAENLSVETLQNNEKAEVISHKENSTETTESGKTVISVEESKHEDMDVALMDVSAVDSEIEMNNNSQDNYSDGSVDDEETQAEKLEELSISVSLVRIENDPTCIGLLDATKQNNYFKAIHQTVFNLVKNAIPLIESNFGYFR